VTLLQRLALGIPQHIRKRGETHFQSGAVRFTETDSSLLEAEVGDRTADQVQLDLDGGQIGYTCTCPPFGDDLEVCEHVWAALLAAESARLLPARHGGRRTVLVPLAEEDEEEEWDDDSEDPFDDFEEDEAGPRNESVRARQAATMRRYWEQMRRGLSGAGPATPRAPARAPKRSAWKQHLDSVRRDSGEAANGRPARSSSTSWKSIEGRRMPASPSRSKAGGRRRTGSGAGLAR
jgi:hypothetical protein